MHVHPQLHLETSVTSLIHNLYDLDNALTTLMHSTHEIPVYPQKGS